MSISHAHVEAIYIHCSLTSCRIWPFRSHYILKTKAVSKDFGLKNSDRMREDSNVQASKQRDGKHGRQIARWHRAIVLAQHQQPDGQLAISSGRVETYQSAISHTQTLPSSAFPFFFLVLLLTPTPFAHLSKDPVPPQGPAKARWHSQCLYVSVCLLLPRQPGHQSSSYWH